MKEYFRKPYMTQGIAKHSEYMKAIPQRAIDVQGQIAPNIEFKKPYDYHPNSPQMIHYYANNLNYLGGDPVPPLNDPSLLPHSPVVVVPEVPVVEYDKYLVSLLHFDGDNASTTFRDESGKTWTVVGNARIDTSQIKFGTASGFFDGTNDSIYSPDSDDWTFDGDFTIDFYLRLSALPVSGDAYYLVTHVGGVNNRWLLYLSNTAGQQEIIFHVIDPTNNVFFLSPCTLAQDTWYHTALTRSGVNSRMFVGGIQIGETTTVMTIGNYSGNLYIGTRGLSTNFDLHGWIDEFRISKGIARWTSNFTPPTKPY